MAERWTQVELKLSVGSEPWVIVRHRKGSFKLPLDAPIGDVLEGVARGWVMRPRGRPGAPATIRVAAERLHSLEVDAGRLV